MDVKGLESGCRQHVLSVDGDAFELITSILKLSSSLPAAGQLTVQGLDRERKSWQSYGLRLPWTRKNALIPSGGSLSTFFKDGSKMLTGEPPGLLVLGFSKVNTGFKYESRIQLSGAFRDVENRMLRFSAPQYGGSHVFGLQCVVGRDGVGNGFQVLIDGDGSPNWLNHNAPSVLIYKRIGSSTSANAASTAVAAASGVDSAPAAATSTDVVT